MADVKADDATPTNRGEAGGRKPRPYHSPRRSAQAADTRARILGAARRLFVERGLTETTIGDIARSAGSSPQAIYATFGSKAGLLLAILDELTAAAGISQLAQQLAAAAQDPRRQLGLYVHFDRRLFEEGSQIIGVGLGARAADQEIEAWFAEGERRRRTNQAPLVREWHRSGALRPGLGERRAADLVWALTGPAVYDLFVTRAGWRPDAYERWLRETLDHQLFG